MKKKATVITTILLALVLTVSLFSACGRQQPTEDTSKTEDYQQLTDDRTEGEIWRDEALRTYKGKYPYVSIVPFDEETKRELEMIPEKFTTYKDNFDVIIENPSKEAEMMLTGAISESKYERHAVAGNENCPVELLVKIAGEDPDRVIRFQAQGNLLSREDLPESYLLKLTESEYEDARLTAIMHPNRTPAIAKALVNDSDPAISEQVRRDLKG